jgi:hypothetical protein
VKRKRRFFYLCSRTAKAIVKDAPDPRALQPPTMDEIVEMPEVGGLLDGNLAKDSQYSISPPPEAELWYANRGTFCGGVAGRSGCRLGFCADCSAAPCWL